MSSENKYLNDQYKSFFEDNLSKTDPELYKAIREELKRQQEHIELIASENIVSNAVLEAQGSVLQINMLKVIQEKDIIMDVNMLMLLKA
tara:strand:- start:924 stop:1190 length:267 start_codon:yes stop_codon:yes gene_type:complete